MVVDKVVDMEAKQDDLVHLPVVEQMEQDQEQQIDRQGLLTPLHQLLKEMQVVLPHLVVVVEVVLAVVVPVVLVTVEMTLEVDLAEMESLLLQVSPFL
tara:strand:- start:57 stop:350 length:294 start_codon:yes stop_codon:yes gene_type:complete